MVGEVSIPFLLGRHTTPALAAIPGATALHTGVIAITLTPLTVLRDVESKDLTKIGQFVKNPKAKKNLNLTSNQLTFISKCERVPDATSEIFIPICLRLHWRPIGALDRLMWREHDILLEHRYTRACLTYSSQFHGSGRVLATLNVCCFLTDIAVNVKSASYLFSIHIYPSLTILTVSEH